MTRYRRCWLVPLAAVVVGASCQSSRRSLPAGPTTVEVIMSDHHFEYEPPAAPGRVVFEARNDGVSEHELVLVRLPDDLPPLAEQLRSRDRRVIPTIASLSSRPPGRTGTFAVDLEPGRYGIICFVEDPGGVQHARKGMSSEFQVG